MSKKEMYAVECEIEVAFARLIGPLAIMNELETYKNIHEELLDLFHVIVKWGTRFQIEKNLDFITPNEIIEIYNRMDKIKEDYLYEVREVSPKLKQLRHEIGMLRGRYHDMEGKLHILEKRMKSACFGGRKRSSSESSNKNSFRVDNYHHIL